jgi:hypothetical protein
MEKANADAQGTPDAPGPTGAPGSIHPHHGPGGGLILGRMRQPEGERVAFGRGRQR